MHIALRWFARGAERRARALQSGAGARGPGTPDRVIYTGARGLLELNVINAESAPGES